jgi:hypothetical protein
MLTTPFHPPAGSVAGAPTTLRTKGVVCNAENGSDMIKVYDTDIDTVLSAGDPVELDEVVYTVSMPPRARSAPHAVSTRP